ncbi:MAG: CRTAC1 family protein [Planctomycetota bacterium]
MSNSSPSSPLRTRFWLSVFIFLFALVQCGCSDKPEPDSQEPEVQSTAGDELVDSDDPDDSVEPVPADSHERMLYELRRVMAETDEKNIFFGTADYRRREEALKGFGDDPDRFITITALGRLDLNLGDEAAAIGRFEEGLHWIENTEFPLDAEMKRQMEIFANYWLGVAYLRKAENENCCAQNNPDSCVVPIRGDGIHTVTEGAEKAIVQFEKVLQITGPQNEEFSKARWLLNIAHMTLGTYPDSVPDEFRVAKDNFESENSFPEFTNVSREAGVDTFSCSGGVIADDFDNDGDVDLVVSDYDPSGQLRYFRNDREDGFVDCTEAANLSGIVGGLNINQADFNNDGLVDIFVMRGGWFGNHSDQPNSLLRNQGDGTFRDVTFDAGLAEVNYPTQAASWGDYDLDGDLDLFIGNETWIQNAPGQLFRNNGDETFTDVAQQSGISVTRVSKAVIWGDYNNDRWPDLFISNLGSPNALYKNNGDGTFTDVAFDVGVFNPYESFPCWFWDYDNDGQLDLYVSSYGAHVNHISAYAAGERVSSEETCLYRNNGSSFELVTEKTGLSAPGAPMGSNFGDINNDGYLDFYLGTGWPDIDELMPNLCFINDGGQQFENVTMASRLGHLQKGHGVVFADFDQDGDQDIFQEIGGAFPGDKYYDALFENPGFGTNWIIIKVDGVDSNRSGIGARIKIEVEEEGEARTIYRHVNSGGTFGANPLRQHIGLGNSEKILSLEVYWPRTDKTQRFDVVPVNALVRITENSDELVEEDYTSFDIKSER